jgi:hypothetical protein
VLGAVNASSHRSDRARAASGIDRTSAQHLRAFVDGRRETRVCVSSQNIVTCSIDVHAAF